MDCAGGLACIIVPALSFLFYQVEVTVAELDGAIVDCALAHFGLMLSGDTAEDLTTLRLPLSSAAPGRVRVVVGDGVALVRRFAAEGIALDAVILDADSKDLSTGQSFPPPAFLAPAFLADVGAILQQRSGCAVFNVAARSRVLFDASVEAVRVGLGGCLPTGDMPEGSSQRSAGFEVCCAAVEEGDLNSLVLARSRTLRLGAASGAAAGSASSVLTAPVDGGYFLPARMSRWAALWGSRFAGEA
jgi:hypothetical protein